MKIFVELPQELERWLHQNETSLARLLRQQGVDARESHELNPFQQEDSDAAERDLKLVLAVTSVAAAVAALGIVANNILATMNKKPVLHISSSLRMVRNAQGNPVFGKDGQPLYELEDNPVLLEPRAENSTTGVQFKFGDKVLLVIGSSRQEIVQQ